MKTPDHIALGENSIRCMNCGNEFEIPMPVTINMFTAMGKAFATDHADCKPSAKGAARTSAADVHAWRSSWDTGVSSKTIWYFMMGQMGRWEAGMAAVWDSRHHGIPHDPSDFGRCYRLLKIAPEWRARLPEMGDAIPRWKPFTDAWAHLEALYEEELQRPDHRAPKLYEAMTKCRDDSYRIATRRKPRKSSP